MKYRVTVYVSPIEDDETIGVAATRDCTVEINNPFLSTTRDSDPYRIHDAANAIMQCLRFNNGGGDQIKVAMIDT